MYAGMRNLVDLLSHDGGYVRIFAERNGYSYELSTYQPRPTADLFERMCGYASVDAACEAARLQLLSIEPRKSVRRRRSPQRGPRLKNFDSQTLLLAGC
jgi:hypothetical protein